jgi:hypothetical protein
MGVASFNTSTGLADFHDFSEPASCVPTLLGSLSQPSQVAARPYLFLPGAKGSPSQVNSKDSQKKSQQQFGQIAWNLRD